MDEQRRRVEDVLETGQFPRRIGQVGRDIQGALALGMLRGGVLFPTGKTDPGPGTDAFLRQDFA